MLGLVAGLVQWLPLAEATAIGFSVPIFSSRLSMAASTLDTKNDATEWILEMSWPAALAASSPAR